MSLKGSPRAFIGLDIGTSVIKLVEIIDRGARQELTTYAHVDLPPSLTSISSRTRASLKPLAQLITQTIEAAQASADAIVMALPSNQIFTTTLTMPNMPEDQMDSAVKFATRDIIPINLDDTILTWSRPGQNHVIPVPAMATTSTSTSADVKHTVESDVNNASPIQETKTIAVYVSVVPKQALRWCMQLAVYLRLELLAIEIEALSLARLFANSSQSSMLLCDIGGHETNFHVVNSGAVLLSRSFDYGSDHIRQALIGASDRSKIQQALNPLYKELKQIIDQIKQKNLKPLNSTMLLGGGAQIPQLKSHWEATLKHPAIISNPWTELTYPEQLEKHLRKIGPQFTLATSLARYSKQ
jgi:Tfp pilus assembly PilM family ATPase